MKYLLERDKRDVFVPGDDTPDGYAIYAITIVDGEEFMRSWLPDRVIVEDPGPLLALDPLTAAPANPLMVRRADGSSYRHTGQAEGFALGGQLAWVFNHKPPTPILGHQSE